MSESNVYESDKFLLSAFDSGIDNWQYVIFRLKSELVSANN